MMHAKQIGFVIDSLAICTPRDVNTELTSPTHRCNIACKHILQFPRPIPEFLSPPHLFHGSSNPLFRSTVEDSTHYCGLAVSSMSLQNFRP